MSTAEALNNSMLPTIVYLPEINKGEVYVGGTISPDGRITHTILMSEERLVKNWDAGMTFAQQQGGDLPNRIEQAMLWAHHRKFFQERAYWSNEQYAHDSDYAWYQSFINGYQGNWHKADETMARAVRRVKD